MTPNQQRLLRFVTEYVTHGEWTHLGDDARPDALILAEEGHVEVNDAEDKYRLAVSASKMREFQCTAEFGPDSETCTAESPKGAAELYAEDHVDMGVDDPPDTVYVDVVDDTGRETEVLVQIDTNHTFKAE